MNDYIYPKVTAEQSLKLDVLNVFVSFKNGDNVLVYLYNKFDIGVRTIKEFAEKVTGNKVIEAYHVPQEELQYYCIDERVWIDTPEKVLKIKQIINR